MLIPIETEPEKKWYETSYVEDSTGCWIWTGRLNNLGYGALRIDNIPKKAHRVFWELHRGPILDGLFVLHKCDVRRCVNPDHLFLGNQQDNMDDMVAKGRSADQRGTKNGNNKLSEAQIIEILDLIEEGYLRNYEIADRYNVAPTTISRIKTVGWQHLKEDR